MSDEALHGGPLAVSADGAVVAVAEGSEILAYDAGNEAPTWIAASPERVVALATAGAILLALDAAGHLRGVDPADGQERWGLGPFGAGAVLGVGVDGRWAVVADGVLRVGQDGDVSRTQPLDDPDVVAVAFAGEVVVLGYWDGRMVFLPADGAPVTRQGFAPLHALASDDADVLVAAEDKIGRMPMEGRGTGLAAWGEPITGVARSPRGKLLAVRIGDRYTAVIAASRSTSPIARCVACGGAKRS